MRKIVETIFSFLFQSEDDQELAIVKDYHAQIKQMDEILSSLVAELKLVHNDLAALSQATKCKREREADFTTENLFRAIFLMRANGWNLRETTLNIRESETLQNFCRLIKKKTMCHTLIDRAFNAIQPETWERVNHSYAIRMKHEGKIDIDHIRSDTTVVETNIHYPTDVSLLWDVYRTIARLVEQARTLGFQVPTMRFHLKDVRKLYLDATRYSNSKVKEQKQKVKHWTGDLLDRVDHAVCQVKQVYLDMMLSSSEAIQYIGKELGRYHPTMIQIVEVAMRRWNGEDVPNTEKIFSLFEEHTELLQRGKRNKPIEFGHSVLFSQTKEKFITDYLVFLLSPSDTKLLSEVMERHADIFGEPIKNLATDKGFRPDEDTFEDLEEEAEFLAVPRRSTLSDVMMKIYQAFRAGIEGTISCLKRAFRLSRCCFRGFKGFCRAVGSAVFCHNVVVMAKAAREAKET
jgi:IS5 family transposase